jgi:hypothetical protein
MIVKLFFIQYTFFIFVSTAIMIIEAYMHLYNDINSNTSIQDSSHKYPFF